MILFDTWHCINIEAKITMSKEAIERKIKHLKVLVQKHVVTQQIDLDCYVTHADWIRG